jgi:hypothetical protein
LSGLGLKENQLSKTDRENYIRLVKKQKEMNLEGNFLDEIVNKAELELHIPVTP